MGKGDGQAGSVGHGGGDAVVTPRSHPQAKNIPTGQTDQGDNDEQTRLPGKRQNRGKSPSITPCQCKVTPQVTPQTDFQILLLL